MVIDEKLEDSVRVTVIATGFGSPAEASKNVITSASIAPPGIDSSVNYEKKLDIPTFARAQSESYDSSKLREVPSIEDEDKYEIPTFLRRQVD